MPIVGELVTLVSAKTAPFERGMKRSRMETKEFTRSVDKGSSSVKDFQKHLVQLGVAAGALTLGRKMIKLAADAETAAIQFETMLGSVTAANRMIRDLDAFSASTPFEPTEIRDAGRALLAFSVAQDNVLDRLRVLGDISAGSGARLSELVNIFGKVRDSGRVSAETLNQFGERAIPLTDALAQTMGRAREEIRGLASAGQIGFDEFLAALKSITAEGGLYEGSLKRQSETLNGLISTLKGELSFALEEVGQEVVKNLDFKETVRESTDSIKELAKTFSEVLIPAIKATKTATDSFDAGIKRSRALLFRIVTAGRPINEKGKVLQKQFQNELKRLDIEAGAATAGVPIVKPAGGSGRKGPTATSIADLGAVAAAASQVGLAASAIGGLSVGDSSLTAGGAKPSAAAGGRLGNLFGFLGAVGGSFAQDIAKSATLRSTTPGLAGAAMKGSQEAISAVNRSLMRTEQQRQVEAAEQAVDLLGGILTEVKKAGVAVLERFE